ncbi:glutaredoxin family protein [Sulfurimonas sp. MAG313]|nr:glutaredoxin domain-containing protein [Sulfurimonas sp. MAG313]MDF1879894.1 glutaredoxin family protein [Sulfurimonas sp. MAG313]
MKFFLFFIGLVLLYLVYTKMTKVDEIPYTEAQYLAEYGPTNTKKLKIQNDLVILLSRPGCGYCTQAKRLLRSKGIKFIEYNVRTSKEGRALFEKYQGTGVPLIIKGPLVIRGYNEQKISKL